MTMNITEAKNTVQISNVADTPVSRAVTYLRELQPAQVTVLANTLFPGNHNFHGRLLFYTYVRTVQNRVKRNINPRIYVPNFVGAPGYGKSAITYDFGFKMTDWLNETFVREGEQDIQFQIMVKTLGGINDFADITGLVYVKEAEGRTGLAVPETFPLGENTMGILFLDDFNRAHGHILAGVMEFVNTGRYNDLVLPNTWGICAGSNPSGGKSRVTSLDDAQYSRFINIPYTRTLDTFFTQLYVQEVEPDLQTYFHKFKDVLQCPDVLDLMPNRVVNDRTRMIFAQMYPVIKNDKLVLTHVADAVFGANMMTELTQVLEGDLPVEPWEILGSDDPQHEDHILVPEKAWVQAKKKLEVYKKARKNDLIVMTGFRMALLCNDKSIELNDKQIDNLCEFIDYIPEDIGMDVMRKLLYTDGPRVQYWRDKLLRWKAEKGQGGGPLSKKFMSQHARLNVTVAEQLAEAGELEKAKANAKAKKTK